jgi:phage shock protein C
MVREGIFPREAFMKRFTRSRTDKMIAGVCGGLGNLMNVDPTLVRLGFVFVAILTAVAPLLVAYLVAWVIVPVEPTEPATPA